MTALTAQSFDSTEFTPSGFGVTVPGPELDEPIDADEVERLLNSGKHALRLPEPLEKTFLRDAGHQRLRTMVISGVLVAFVFNWLLLSDWLLTPDQFDLALRLRLFLFTPAIIVGVFLLPRLPSPSMREWLLVAPGAGAAAINAWLSISSSDPFAAPYLVSLASIAMFSNSVVRMRFAPAVVLDVIIMALYVVAALSMSAEHIPILIPGVLLLSCTMVFTLYGCYCQERDDRLNWLLHLRERLLLKDLESANLELHDASRSDMLTEVANRRHFDEHLAEVWEQVKRDGGEVAIMMIDVDHFKAYNDRYGHPVGDACLRAVAGALKRRLRGPGDLIARYGGEEFIAVLGGTSLPTVRGAAERIRRGIEGLNLLHATSSTHEVVTVSIGVATMNPSADGATITRLISAADTALYQAKDGGRNRVVAMGLDE
ncbi:MAG: hypothetical protein QG554_885 [Pseudomonadota bacterium]|jgi:diguanylate cyclase (GGDEF)-like protein|nr:hypothetical protein [Pseudomonadota bacterium]